VTVVDAGVAVEALISDNELGKAARRALREPCTAPELIDIEVGSALRRLVLAGRLSERRARLALHDLHDLPLVRSPHRPLLPRCWALRGSVTFYDAAYVALAELLAVPLVTTDGRLAAAPGPRCEFALLS
jgi:predicted nucleic acid-binding protein